ncbi:MAG: hypothetical protein V4689_20830 [Verrucomicrobiota bacterium]
MRHPFTHPLAFTLSRLAVIALLVSQSCTAQPRSATGGSRTSPSSAARQTAAAKPVPAGRSQGRKPDPRYRPPLNFGELREVAGQVAKSTRRAIHWQLEPGANPGPLARITGGIDDCRIYIHPVAARQVPPNTWAFIIGHEFAHRVENLGTHSQTNPANELKADIAGARYAMAAGYRLEAFLGWVLAQPDQTTDSHGSLHGRVRSVAAHFGIPQRVIQAETKRYPASR